MEQKAKNRGRWRLLAVLLGLAACGVGGPAARADLITFDDIPTGPIGAQYVGRGVRFLVGNGSEGNSTQLLVIDGRPASAYAGNFGTGVSQPNVLVPRPGTNEDILVHFYDPAGNRRFASQIGVTNDADGLPIRIFLEGLDERGESLGRAQIDGRGVTGTFAAPNIFTARIYGAPGYPGHLGVDDFTFTLADTAETPEPGTLTLAGMGLLGLFGYQCGRRKRNGR